MLSHPHSSLLTPRHQTANLESLHNSERFGLQRTLSVSSLLFARRPSVTGSIASVASRQLSPVHQHIRDRQNFSSIELDHCWGGAGSRRSRDDHRDSNQDLYDFLKAADLQEYYTVFSKHLKIRTVNQLKYVTDIELTEMGMSRPEVRRLRRYFEKVYPQTAMGKLKKKLIRSTSARPPVRNQHASTEPPADDEESIFSDTNSIFSYHLIGTNELELTSSLGQGEFGHVYQGLWRSASTGRQSQVAVKVLDLDRFPTKVDDFLKEAVIMNSLDHPDIVRLHGICVAPKCLRLVTELAPLRSLLECLREPDLRTSFPVSTLHNFAIQIARGMAYLEEERLVHRDLAARNILVFTKDKIKIGDFGLSQALQLGKSYYQTNFNANLRLPIAWCALEAIHELCFTSASDVWSYGVTLWEMFTYGFVPWTGLSGRQILEAVDMPNCQRLAQPDACPDAVFDAVMRACWNHEPTSRPTFAQLTEMLPHLSPQSWYVAEDSEEAESTLPRTVEDIRNLLMEDPSNADINGSSSSSLNKKTLLRVRAGEIVYVLSKKNAALWKVVSHSTCQVGYVPPENLLPLPPTTDIITTSRSTGTNQNYQTSTLSRMRLRFGRRGSEASLPDFGQSSRNSLKVGKLNRDLISLPQNDFRHVGHVGADGTMFGDVGFSLDNVEEDAQGPSPADSCMTMEGTSDKENPSLSDVTIGERTSCGSSIPFDRVKVIPSRAATTSTAASTIVSLPPPSNTPLENNRTSTATKNSSSISSTHPPPVENAPPSSSSWFSSTFAYGVEELDSSILDMGSSFMDEVFQCLSAKTDGLGLLDTIEKPQSSVVLDAPRPPPSPPAALPPEEEVTPVPLPLVTSKSTGIREVTPFKGSNRIATATSPNSMKRLSLDHADGDRYRRPSPPLSSLTNDMSDRAYAPLINNTSLRRGRTSGGSEGGGSSVFVNATSTLTRAFRKSSASLTRRPAQVTSDKAPSALSLEHPPYLDQMPPIKASLNGTGKLKRPVISGPVIIANPTLASGASISSILSSESTTTAAVSTPPSTLTSSCGTSLDSSITATSSPLSLSGAGAVTPITTTTPSISPAPSTSSLATSSTSSSNLVLHHLGHGHYQSSRFTNGAAFNGFHGSGGSGGGGLRVLRDRGDLVFRATAAPVAFGGRRRANPGSGVDYQQRSTGYAGGTLDSRHPSLLPPCPATETLPRRNYFRERARVTVADGNSDAPLSSSYSTSNRAIGHAVDSQACDTEGPSSAVTPNAFVYPVKINATPRNASQSFGEGESFQTKSSSPPASGLSEELLGFWGSEFASILGAGSSTAS